MLFLFCFFLFVHDWSTRVEQGTFKGTTCLTTVVFIFGFFVLVVFFCPGVPGKPSIISRVQQVETNELNLKWTAPDYDGGDSRITYKVEWKPIGSGEPKVKTGIKELEVTLTDLSFNTEYEVKLYAVNQQGPSDPATMYFKVGDGESPVSSKSLYSWSLLHDPVFEDLAPGFGKLWVQLHRVTCRIFTLVVSFHVVLLSPPTYSFSSCIREPSCLPLETKSAFSLPAIPCGMLLLLLAVFAHRATKGASSLLHVRSMLWFWKQQRFCDRVA